MLSKTQETPKELKKKKLGSPTWGTAKELDQAAGFTFLNKSQGTAKELWRK